MALKVNENAAFETDPVTWKSAQDRYKRLQEQYNQNDNENQRLSGVGGGEMGELADILMTMREAKDDWESQKKAVKTKERRKEEDKERMGQALVDAAKKRKRNSSSEVESGNGSENGGNGSENGGSPSSRKSKKLRFAANSSGGELDMFGAHLKEADLARTALERERLSFEQERGEEDRREREKEREERRKEREEERRERREGRIENQKLELEKFKAMIEAFNRNK